MRCLCVGVSHLFLFVAEGLPLLGNQLRTLAERNVFEIAAGLAADRELHERGGVSLDLTLIPDGRPLLRALRIQAAAQLGASQVCDLDFIHVVGIYPSCVLCISSFFGCVNEVIVVLFVLARNAIK